MKKPIEYGWLSLGDFAYGLLDGTKNALKNAPMEYKFLASNLLASLWCIAFGIFTAELLFIGYNIIGHIALITMVFFTWFVFTAERKKADPAPPNKCRWDLEQEG